MQCPDRSLGSWSNTYPFETYHIHSQPIIEAKSNEKYQYYANEALYLDLKNHFPKLWELLQRWEEKVRMEGPELLRSYYDICDILYDDLNDLAILRMKKNLTDPFERPNESPYDGAVLNILLGEDESTWPNLKSKCGEDFPKVREIGEKYEDRNEVKLIRRLLEEFRRLKKECDREIEIAVVEKNLKGRCGYI